MVVDRVLLLIFTTTTLGITAAILLHAPLSRDFLFGGDFAVDLAGSAADAADNHTSNSSSRWTCLAAVVEYELPFLSHTYLT